MNHIHQKHPEKDCSTFSCWTCGIKFRKEAQMKRHMKTVKHELEARKYIIPDEELMEDDAHLKVIDQETDLSQLLDPTDSTSSEINIKEIPPTDIHSNPDEERNQVILNDQTGIFEEINRNKQKDTKKDNQIEKVVNNLLEALNENPSTKEEILGYINQEDDFVDLEIDDWLTMDSWGNTPAVEAMIPIEFENL